ncbi:MAG: hypothetical protein ACFFAS_09990 [Promethearchaeota archaeon]
MSKASTHEGTAKWDFYGIEGEENWMRTLIEYILRPWKYKFGFRS